MIARSLLEILCCPETHQALDVAEVSLLNALNQKVAFGLLTNRAGKPVAAPVEEWLIREDQMFVYAVRKSIPVMLVDEGIPLAQFGSVNQISSPARST